MVTAALKFKDACSLERKAMTNLDSVLKTRDITLPNKLCIVKAMVFPVVMYWKDWCWIWSSNTLATWSEELSHWKRLWCWERLKVGGEGTTVDEMAGWHHWLNGHEFEQNQGDNEGQGSLMWFSPWGCKQLDMTEWLNNNFPYGPTITSIHDYLKNHSFDYMNLCWQSDISAFQYAV